MEKTETKRSQVVSEVIRERRTSKVLATKSTIVPNAEDLLRQGDSAVSEAIKDAGFAPFHYDRNVDGIAEPWRFYFIRRDDCRFLAQELKKWDSEMKPSNKLPSMLAACGSLVLVNWLPQFNSQNVDSKQRQIDEEHLAATAAATQNLLLSLTARGLKTYWSSGGSFRKSSVQERLGIDTAQRLLAAVFVDYGHASNVEILSGKQHQNRTDCAQWTKQIRLV